MACGPRSSDTSEPGDLEGEACAGFYIDPYGDLDVGIPGWRLCGEGDRLQKCESFTIGAGDGAWGPCEEPANCEVGVVLPAPPVQDGDCVENTYCAEFEGLSDWTETWACPY